MQTLAEEALLQLHLIFGSETQHFLGDRSDLFLRPHALQEIKRLLLLWVVVLHSKRDFGQGCLAAQLHIILICLGLDPRSQVAVLLGLGNPFGPPLRLGELTPPCQPPLTHAACEATSWGSDRTTSNHVLLPVHRPPSCL